MDDVMAGWYKQHTSELASLEAFAQCGRTHLVIAWLRVTRWTVDHESDELPEALQADAVELEAAGLRTTFAARCKKLLDQREAMAAKRESKRAHVSSSELTSDHVSSSDHQDKTRQDKTKQDEKDIEDRKENAAGGGDAKVTKRETREQLVARFDAWTPSDETAAKLQELGCDLESERPIIRDWLLSTQKPWKGDFDAGVRNWARRNAPKAAPKAEEHIPRAPAGAIRYMELKKAGLVG